MKVTFLGSSHGFPEPHRRCSCTLVEIGDKKYLIDMGIMVVEDLINLGMKPEEITAVFFTHMHGDHTNGLISFADLISWHYKEANPIFYLPDLAGKEALKQWMAVTGTTLRPELVFRPVEEGKIYQDDTLKVTAVRTEHNQASFGFILEAEDKTVVFTGDMKHGDGPLVDYPKLVDHAGIDLVVCESAHFTPDLYEYNFCAFPPKRIVFNHYVGRNIGKIYQVIEDMKDIAPVEMATDGKCLTV